jgi:hypothetical protein
MIGYAVEWNDEREDGIRRHTHEDGVDWLEHYEQDPHPTRSGGMWVWSRRSDQSDDILTGRR